MPDCVARPAGCVREGQVKKNFTVLFSVYQRMPDNKLFLKDKKYWPEPCKILGSTDAGCGRALDQ